MVDAGDRARDEFFSEAQEIVEGLGRDLLALDEAVRANRVDPDLINDIFRAVHTLKGLAGLFGATRMATLSHELEEVLDNLRLGRIDVSPVVLDMLFRSIELYGRILQVEKDGSELPIPEVDELLRELHRGFGQREQQPLAAEYDLDPGLLAVLTEYEEHRLRTNIQSGLILYRIRVHFQLATIDQALDELKATAKPFGEIITYLPTGTGADADSIELDILMASRSSVDELRRALAETGAEVEEIPRRPGGDVSGGLAAGAAGGGFDSGGLSSRPAMSASGPVSPHPRSSDPGALAAPPDSGAGGRKKRGELGSIRSVAQTVRVDINKLDRLMNTVGELALVRSSLGAIVERLRATPAEREMSLELHRLQRTFERHLAAIQQGILEVRMVPLGQVFDKLARVVRQISRDADKIVNLVITGAETEVDKLIVEELSDPLMHMMRNAIDHGIETRAEREAVGKPAVGTIALNAFQKGNHVVIEIEDDGRGIDATRLLDVALRRGLITQEEARTTSYREALTLIFLPGVSTKSDVSEISGRGVGMDVVKTNIGRLGGVIDVTSEVGIGTKMTVTLPITLAIISALIVRVADRLFAIPLANVQEAVGLDDHAVKRIDGREMITLRNQTLQLCYLTRLFGLDEEEELSSRIAGLLGGTRSLGGVRGGITGSRKLDRSSLGLSPGSKRKYIVVTAVGTKRLGLVVSALIGQQDVVIKTFGPSLASVRGFAGATELGDQRIALVIDAPALIFEVLSGGDRARPEPRGVHG
ncbi:chemotaxis protein CheA [Chondromyces apiculatus]|uniref:histidine kinase n=1 Tax=Chondromyces apiculatus DSM 436 TaxID=1192034 RepID=A0A017SUQ6_9BACT|nr:chemotaxis protein CheA [Chondromyces apiculatus]EYF00345.1 Signal transduction histidine kinase CheA [Chondromyces apiculatus DSM 436]